MCIGPVVSSNGTQTKQVNDQSSDESKEPFIINIIIV